MPTWILYALLSAFFAALTALFAKLGLKDVNSDLATAIRTVIILVMTWGIVFFKGVHHVGNLTKNNWIFLVLSALATGMSWLFYYRALQLGKVSEVTVIDKSSLVLTMILAFIFLKEPVTLKLILGSLLVIGGIFIITWK